MGTGAGYVFSSDGTVSFSVSASVFSPPASADPRGTCSSPSFSLSGGFEHRQAQHWDQHLLLDRGDVDGAMAGGHVKDSSGGSSFLLVTGNEATSIMRALHTSLCLSSGFQVDGFGIRSRSGMAL